ncbi:hypothetical protein D9613_011133 [Agrocybe pediades]|uniref:Uncharacterized protein n=1 Tax=Agrocybe pediades TaxID=84607 RepID=A0A8H4QL84_9AGAR|nr:hypothetical protein D9613_011133 [Agrocybe pediades]KAF9564073.1 hypothetical protein CPC08DRAFT_705611 [Agrocybe pediades]
MKTFSTTVILLLAIATSALGQAPGPDFIDDVFARDDIPGSDVKLSAREFEEIQVRHAEDLFKAKRDLENLERRSKRACYAGCEQFNGTHKINCWRKCDRVWGH